MLIVTGVDDRSLSMGYESIEDRTIYDKAWDETAELIITDEIKDSKVEKSAIDGVR